MRIEIDIAADYLEKILNGGLKVLVTLRALSVGDNFALREVAEDAYPTGRKFFAKVDHVLPGGVVQFTLASFMEMASEQKGEKPERIPMFGEAANEKYETPTEGVKGKWLLPVKGEKPIWIYEGIKWRAEIAISELVFEESKGLVPSMVMLKIQAQGGEVIMPYSFDIPDEKVAS